MKKFSLIVLLCSIATMISCSKQEHKVDGIEGNCDVSINMSCFGLSGDTPSVSTVRYIVEMYAKADVEAWRANKDFLLKAVKREVFSGSGFATDPTTPESFDLRVVAGEYYILAWADNGAVYYNTPSLTNITSLKSDIMNDDKKEAFGYVSPTPIVINANMTLPQITMKHTVGKVTVQTSDIFHLYTEYNGEEGFDPTGKSHVSFNEISLTYGTYYNKLNMIDHIVTSEVAPRKVVVTNIGEEYYDEEIEVLVTDYVFMPLENSSGSVDFAVVMSNDAVARFRRSGLSLCNNSHTLFTGDILTDGVVINLNVDGSWDEKNI